jgi:hypothetical protein
MNTSLSKVTDCDLPSNSIQIYFILLKQRKDCGNDPLSIGLLFGGRIKSMGWRGGRRGNRQLRTKRGVRNSQESSYTRAENRKRIENQVQNRKRIENQVQNRKRIEKQAQNRKRIKNLV